ncbi:MAG: hypothetical protein KGM18_00845 [Sphingomonadales bacterium]|nr:hypothetical protein [Sphingomonadales bacterium]
MSIASRELPALLAIAPAALFEWDGLAITMAALTLFVAAVVVAFSRRYMRADRATGAYFGLVAALVACVLAIVSAANAIVLAFAWIASGVLLARLIGHARDLADAPEARRRAHRAFTLGDAALLAALAMACDHAGSLQLAAVLATAPSLPALSAMAIGVLLVIAAAARCGLPPLSGWLLSSMTAPTPVSALMHAGLVNAGGFLLIRFAPLMEAAPGARLVAIGLGLFAAIYGIGVMVVRPDVKRALAGSTVSQMGFMLMSCGLGAYGAALWHIVAHGLFKAWLFLGSGSTIGVRPCVPAEADPGIRASAIAAVTLAGAAAALLSGAGAAIVPLALAAATGAAVLVGRLRADGPVALRTILLLAVAGLAAIQTIGLALVHAVAPPDGAAVLSPGAILALLAALLGLWVWQQRRQAAGASLPPHLYVRLLNAGV